MIKFYLLINAILYFIFAIWCTLDPYWTAEAVGFQLPSNQGYAEFVAVYGGLEFSVGLFFLITALIKRYNLIGIIFGSCFYTSLFMFRTIAIITVGINIGAGINFYITEALFTVWSLLLLKTTIYKNEN
jgi:hypothetical protein